MSYIRCLSNPDGLYIWGEYGYVVVSCGMEANQMPTHIFEGLILKLLEHQESVKYRGAALTEPDYDGPHPQDLRWTLSYPSRWRTQTFKAHLVTWIYIGTQNWIGGSEPAYRLLLDKIKKKRKK